MLEVRKNVSRKFGKKSISKQMVTYLLCLLISVNVVVGAFFYPTLLIPILVKEKESSLSQISETIKSKTESFIDQYVSLCEVLAQNSSISTLLESSNSLPMSANPYSQVVATDMRNIKSNYSDVLYSVGIGSVSEDNLMDDSGTIYSSKDEFQLSTRSYYQAVVDKKTFITDPYLDAFTNELCITISTPVYDTTKTNVVGMVILDVSIGSLESFLVENKFGKTGLVSIIDKNDNVVAYSNPGYGGKNLITEVGLNDSNYLNELNNITGQRIKYKSDGIKRTAFIDKLSNVDWKVDVAMDVSEFYEPVYKVTLLSVSVQILLILFTLVFISIRLNKALSPISNINEAVRNLADGNLDYELEDIQDNEIGELSENLKFTMDSLADYINSISDNMKKLARGDFNVELDEDFRGEFKVIKDSIQEFSSSMSDTLSSIISSVNQVSLGSEQVSSISQSLAQGATEQAASVEELDSLVNSLADNVKVSALNTNEISKEANGIQEQVEISNKQMESMLEAMDQITSASNEISKIITQIEDVAFQTNILALNAAVEAARAGSAGKGFAVVADEVRNLASKTSESAKNTTVLIQKSIDAVKNGSELAHSAAHSLSKVVTNVDGITSKISSVSESATEQSNSVEEVRQILGEISSVVQNNSATSEESAASSEELSAQAQHMDDLVNQFKLID